MEIWKEVQGHPDYKISSSGKLWSNKSQREMVVDHKLVVLDGESIRFPTLMGIHFIEGYHQGMTLTRKDKTKSDWSVDNLQIVPPNEWCRSEEFKESLREGWAKKNGKILARKGEQLVVARSTREMAELINVPKSTVAYHLKNGTPHKTGWIFTRE